MEWLLEWPNNLRIQIRSNRDPRRSEAHWCVHDGGIFCSVKSSYLRARVPLLSRLHSLFNFAFLPFQSRCSFVFVLNDPVHFAANQNRQTSDIQPQHEDYHSSQRSI